MNKKLKPFRLLSFVFAIGLLSGACSKDENKSKKKDYPVEDPLAAYLEAGGFNQSTYNIVNGKYTYELGFSFKPKVNGQINAISLQIPTDVENVRVTIWDVLTETSIRTLTFSNLKNGLKQKQTITPLPLSAGVEYMISFNNNDYYRRAKDTEAPNPYPVSAGNLEITGVYRVETTDPVLPKVSTVNSYYGDVSFEFQQAD